MGSDWQIRPQPDWWQKAGVVIAFLTLLAMAGSGAFAGAVWVIDHRIDDHLKPVLADLSAIKQQLGIPPQFVGGR